MLFVERKGAKHHHVLGAGRLFVQAPALHRSENLYACVPPVTPQIWKLPGYPFRGFTFCVQATVCNKLIKIVLVISIAAAS